MLQLKKEISFNPDKNLFIRKGINENVKIQ